ncbi:amidase [Streptomyces sp. SID14478]|uniref:amidase family protein n=1 Tax=Streptomyces sp. SID14478 TaxID=2706073 RepID=UPI0013DF42D6|nr:amidase [Streptomyces sp. SID14478]
MTGTENTTTVTAVEIAAAVRAGAVSARDITVSTLARISADDRLRAFTQCWPEAALAQAEHVDRRIRQGEPLPLAGVPLAVKATEGLTALQTRRLMAAGCIPVGATATPGPGTNWQTWGATHNGPTLNPHHPDWSPGGSSAGSAAAVAAGLVPLATGSDGAGSVRIPAAWCSIIGLKPTNGLVPARDRAGLNTSGPLARTVADTAAYLAVLAGDTTLRRQPATTTPPRTAWSATLGFAKTTASVAATAHARLTEAAATDTLHLSDTKVTLPNPAPCWHAMRSRSTHDAANATGQAAALTAAVDQLFDTVDLLATPTTPNTPHGHDGPGHTMSVALTWAFNITGHPAISLPAGLTPAGEPVGLQLIARRGHEQNLLTLAAAIERL